MSFIYTIVTLFSKIAYYLSRLGPALKLTSLKLKDTAENLVYKPMGLYNSKCLFDGLISREEGGGVYNRGSGVMFEP